MSQIETPDDKSFSSDDAIASQVVDAAFCVHQALGSGLLESAYENCLVYELKKRGLSVQSQVPMRIAYYDVQLEVGYRVDVLVNSRIILEVKAVQELLPIHQAQLLTYLKLSGCRIGFLLNFNSIMFRTGIRRLVL